MFREVAVCEGYGRQNCDYTIPVTITQLCAVYYTSSIRWKIHENTIKQLMDSTTKIHHEALTIHGVSFKVYLKREDDSIIFGMDRKINGEIDAYKFYYELYCKDTKSHWVDTCEHIRHTSGLSRWNDNTLKVSECINKKYLTFYYAIDMLRAGKYRKNITIDKRFMFDWNISHKELKSYLNCPYNRCIWYTKKQHGIFSPYFDPKMLSVTMLSYKTGCYGVDITGLLPEGIKNITVKFTVKDVKNGFVFEEMKSFVGSDRFTIFGDVSK